MDSNREKELAVIGVMAVTLVSSLPAMVDYNIGSGDLMFYLTRIEAVSQNIKWNSLFDGTLILLLPTLLRLGGIGLSTAYNLFVTAVNLVTAWIAYISFSKCFGDRAVGILGSACYTLAPYRIDAVYSQGALGEYTAMIFLPMLFWVFAGQEKVWKRVVPPIITIFGVWQAHMLTGAKLHTQGITGGVGLWLRSHYREAMVLFGVAGICALALWILRRARGFLSGRMILALAVIGVLVTSAYRADHILYTGAEIVRLENFDEAVE